MINISKGITKFEKLIDSWEQLKMKVANEIVSTITGGVPVHDLQHIDCRFLLDSFSVKIHLEIENRVSNAKTMMKLSLVSVTLKNCNMLTYQQELEGIQDKYFIEKIGKENVFIPNYVSMVAISNSYRAFRDKLIISGQIEFISRRLVSRCICIFGNYSLNYVFKVMYFYRNCV